MKKPTKQWFWAACCSLILLAGIAGPARAAILTVVNTNNSGAGSFRQALADATSGDTIVFNLTYPATITLSSTLTLNKNLTILGPGNGNLTISGNNAVRVFDVTSGTIVISKMTIANGRIASAGSDGAGFRINGTINLTLNQCLVRNHDLSGGFNEGAAFWVSPLASLTINHSTLSNNSTPMTAGSEGAGIFCYGDCTLNSVTISGSSAAAGPAIMNRGSAGKTFDLINCTISGNNSAYDGAIIHQWTGTMNLINCTITQNSTLLYEGGFFADTGVVTLRNTIIAANTSADPQGYTDMDIDIGGLYNGDSVTFTSYGYNLIGSTGGTTYTWTTGDVVGTEGSPQSPNLGSLTNNGGYVLTHDPNAGSQVINPASSNSAPFVDGRGYLRSSTAEKGACEDGGALPVATSATGTGSTSFAANWNSASGASGYYLDVAEDSGFLVMVSGYQDLDVGNVQTYPVTGLSEGVTYYYRIRAYNGATRSYYSNTITETTTSSTPTFTPSATPSATQTLTATATSTVTLSGTPSPSPTESQTFTPTGTPSLTTTVSLTVTPTLTASATASPSNTVSPTHTPSPSHTSSHTISPTLTQTLVVTATPTSTASLTRTATLTASPTTMASMLDTSILAYPNPARDQMDFAFDLEQDGEVMVGIYNLTGERIAVLKESLPAGPGSMTWQCGAVAPGVYIAKIKAGQTSRIIKVAVIK